MTFVVVVVLLLQTSDAADAFSEPFSIRPVAKVARSHEDRVTVTYDGGEAIDCARLADVEKTVDNCRARIEVFVGTFPSEAELAKGKRLAEGEPNSFFTQTVMVIRPLPGAAEPQNWQGRQMFRKTDDGQGMLLEIVHSEAGAGTVCIGPRLGLPRLDKEREFKTTRFKEIGKDSNRWIFVDTPCLPAEVVPETGRGYAAADGADSVPLVRVHRGETMRLHRRFATFFWADGSHKRASGFFRIDWSQDIEVKVAEKREDWIGRVAPLTKADISVSGAGDHPDLTDAMRRTPYMFDDGYNEARVPSVDGPRRPR